MNQSEEFERFRKALYSIGQTPEWEIISEYLRDIYVSASAFGHDPQSTAYKLGQKEFVQAILEDSQKEFKLDTSGDWND